MSPYPISITQLRLLSSFNGFAVNITDCLTIHSDEIFYAYDDKALKYSVCTNSIPSELLLNQEYFTIKNDSKKNIIFWSIDGKFITKSKMQKCDCAIFDENTFCLVEFKTYLYLQPIITQYFIDNKSEIWLLFLIAHSKR